MKTVHLLLALWILSFISCGQQKENNFANYEDGYTENVPDENIKKHKATNSIKGYQVMSKQFGMPVGTMPIPSSWQVKNNKKEGILFESADGVKVYGERFKSHFYSNNQQQNYFAKQGGSIVMPPKSISRVIQEDIKPYAESQGLRLVNQFPIPELAQFDKRFDSYLFKGVPENKQFQCIATEWEDQNGDKSIGIIRYFTNQYTTLGGMDWGYTLNSMGAPSDKYKQAKKDFINSLVNFQINPQWVQASNQHYAKLSGQSAAAHQQRMAAIKAQGQAIINNGNTYSSIIDSNHESWKRRNDMNSAGHAKTVNSGIWERSTVTNPNSGQSYQVEGQYDYYYGNNDDGYIGTDNALYNPNLDPI
ncbi:hypothetical protein ABI125_14110 [Tamlana crocina]